MTTNQDLVRRAHDALLAEYYGTTTADLQAFLARVDPRWADGALRTQLVRRLAEYASAQALPATNGSGLVRRQAVHVGILELYDQLRRQTVAAHLASRSRRQSAES